MRLGTVIWSSFIFAAIAVASNPASPPAVHPCAIGKLMSASKTSDLKAEATAIFKEVEFDARQSLNDADRLQSLEVDPNVSRETQGELLNDVKDEINDIEAKLCRLETMRSALAPWQQRVIDQVATAGRLMADNAQDAIALCNNNPAELKLPTYWHYTNNLYKQASTLTKSVGDAVKFAGISTEYRKLGHELGAKNPS